MTKNKIASFLIILTALVILLHLLIMIKIIPYKAVWGGRLQSDTEMYFFEATSILVNAFLIFILLMKTGRIYPYFKEKLQDIILWVFLVLFILNTVGNIFAETLFEKSLALLTLFFALCLGVILKKKPLGKAKK